MTMISTKTRPRRLARLGVAAVAAAAALSTGASIAGATEACEPSAVCADGGEVITMIGEPEFPTVTVAEPTVTDADPAPIADASSPAVLLADQPAPVVEAVAAPPVRAMASSVMPTTIIVAKNQVGSTTPGRLPSTGPLAIALEALVGAALVAAGVGARRVAAR